MRISGRSHDNDYWKFNFKTVPVVKLNGNVVKRPVEARDGDWGYVIVEVLDESGFPVLADVVLPDGEVINKIIATRTLRGTVTISEAEPA